LFVTDRFQAMRFPADMRIGDDVKLPDKVVAPLYRTSVASEHSGRRCYWK
jgi:hypothetical protein